MKSCFSILSLVLLHVGIINTITTILAKKTGNLSRTNKINLNCDVIDGSIQNGLKQPLLFSFVLDKKPGFKVCCDPGTIHYKKINKSVLKTITFYLEHNDNRGAIFYGETLTFTLKMIK